MVMDTLGLASCVALTWAVRNSQQARFWLPLAVLPVCGLGDLASIYAELKSVHLRILNKERAELICESWLASGTVPSARQVGILCGMTSALSGACRMRRGTHLLCLGAKQAIASTAC